MSQAELARAAGVSQSLLSHIERGDKVLTERVARLVAPALAERGRFDVEQVVGWLLGARKSLRGEPIIYGT